MRRCIDPSVGIDKPCRVFVGVGTDFSIGGWQSVVPHGSRKHGGGTWKGALVCAFRAREGNSSLFHTVAATEITQPNGFFFRDFAWVCAIFVFGSMRHTSTHKEEEYVQRTYARMNNVPSRVMIFLPFVEAGMPSRFPPACTQHSSSSSACHSFSSFLVEEARVRRSTPRDSCIRRSKCLPR